jgi:hypothetical protein
MLKSLTTILVVFASLSACATTPTPSPGKGMVLGIKPGGPVELIIRTVDGKIQGDLPYNPAYSAELEPGTHKIGPFCKVRTSYGQTMGPTDDVSLTVEAGRTYKLEATPGGKQCIVRVVTLPQK